MAAGGVAGAKSRALCRNPALLSKISVRNNDRGVHNFTALYGQASEVAGESSAPAD
jgi:hypothetical protein